MGRIKRFSLIMLSVLVFAMPVYTQDSKESKGNANKPDKAESRDKTANEKADAGGSRGSRDAGGSRGSRDGDASRGSSRDREPNDRACGGGTKP